MTGALHTKDTLAQQQPPHGATAPAASANGNSTINKKRKKDGLKPIITTEGPGYVHRALHHAPLRELFGGLDFFLFFFLSLPFFLSPSLCSISRTWMAVPRVGFEGSDVLQPTHQPGGHNLRSACLSDVVGCDRRAMGWDP